MRIVQKGEDKRGKNMCSHLILTSCIFLVEQEPEYLRKA